jgi:hypothetical protein
MPLWSGITHLSNAISKVGVDRSFRGFFGDDEQSASHGNIRRPSPLSPSPRLLRPHSSSAEDPEEIITAAYTRELPFAVLLQALLYAAIRIDAALPVRWEAMAVDQQFCDRP